MFNFIYFSLFIPKNVFEKEQFDTETLNVGPLNIIKFYWLIQILYFKYICIKWNTNFLKIHIIVFSYVLEINRKYIEQFFFSKEKV